MEALNQILALNFTESGNKRAVAKADAQKKKEIEKEKLAKQPASKKKKKTGATKKKTGATKKNRGGAGKSEQQGNKKRDNGSGGLCSLHPNAMEFKEIPKKHFGHHGVVPDRCGGYLHLVDQVHKEACCSKQSDPKKLCRAVHMCSECTHSNIDPHFFCPSCYAIYMIGEVTNFSTQLPKKRCRRDLKIVSV